MKFWFKKDVNAYINKAISEIKKHNYKEALSFWNKALEIRPNDDNILADRGITKSKLQDFKGALEDLTRTIEINL